MNRFSNAPPSGSNSAVLAVLIEAMRLEKEGRYEDSLARCQAFLKLSPRHPDAMHLLGVLAMHQGRLDEAADTLRKTVKLSPKLADAYINLAHVYSLQQRWRERADTLKAALTLLPGHPQILSDIGKCYEYLSRWSEAADFYQKALAAGADPVGTWVNLSAVLLRIGRYDETEAAIASALARDPGNAMAHVNRAVLRDLQGDLDAALPAIDAAIAAHPDHVDAHYHRALALLARGRFKEGWEEFDWRFKRPAGQTHHASYPLPYWQGESLAGRSLLIWTEQGPGDEILLGTMIPDVIGQADHGVIACTPRLIPLFARAFPTASVVSLGAADAAMAITPRPDVQASLSHLGRYLRPSFESFPTQAGYLKADSARAAALRERYLSRAAGKRLVGISWRSAAVLASGEKSTELRDWHKLLKQPNVQFVSLQYGDVKSEVARAAKDSGIDIIHDSSIDPLKDLDAFTAQVAAMDDVISVSNTTVHVAGGLGKPVSVLVPASYGRIWYWFLDRTDSPWYPSLRLFRQGRGQPWSEVVDAVVDQTARAT